MLLLIMLINPVNFSDFQRKMLKRLQERRTAAAATETPVERFTRQLNKLTE